MLACILLIVVIDLWYFVDPRIPTNHPYYLMLTEQELEQVERIKQQKKEFMQRQYEKKMEEKLKLKHARDQAKRQFKEYHGKTNASLFQST